MPGRGWFNRGVDVVTVNLAGLVVDLRLPQGARFSELGGLHGGSRHLTWSPCPTAHLMVSCGDTPGFSPRGMLSEEARRGTVEELSEQPRDDLLPGARRVRYTLATIASSERRLVDGATIDTGTLAVREHVDLLFLPADPPVRIGIRANHEVPREMRAVLTGALASVRIRAAPG